MVSKKFSQRALNLFTSIFLTSFGIIFFQQRTQEASSFLNILTYDAQMYLSMTNGIEVSGPHACRILLPFLAKLLPMEPLKAVFFINVVSLVILFSSLIIMLENFLIKKNVIIITIVIFFSTYSLAYNFTNPFLTDLPALATMILFINSIIKYRYLSCLLFFAASLLFRETIIVLLPLFFLTFSLKKSMLAMFFGLFIYFIPKLIIAGDIYCNFNPPFSVTLLINTEFLIKTILSYGPIWLLGFAGLTKLSSLNKNLSKIAFSILILSLVGSVLSSFKSTTDITRMYILMLPILILGSAMLINNILLQKYSSIYLVIISISGLFASIGYFPNIFIEAELNSLKEFAKSNYIIIVSSIFIQSIFIFIVIKKFLIESFNYGSRN